MLSTAQINLHWNMKFGWGRVCHANDWYMAKGRMDMEATKADYSQWHRKVWAFAEMLARAAHRGVTPDDLRKGTYMLALGVPKSFTKFDNGDLDRVLIAFRLLIEPDDLKAVNDFCAYEAFDQAKAEMARCRQLGLPCAVALPDDPGEIRRHMFFVKQAPEAILRHFCRDRFGGKLPEDMTLEELRQLTRTLKNRKDYGRRTELNARSPQGVNEPPMIHDEMIPF